MAPAPTYQFTNPDSAVELSGYYLYLQQTAESNTSGRGLILTVQFGPAS
jgi:hypothetical protein